MSEKMNSKLEMLYKEFDDMSVEARGKFELDCAC